MARYTTTVATNWSADEAFDYMADLRNFEEWDPGVKSSKIVTGDTAGLDAEYDVTVGFTTLRYVTKEFQKPRRAVVEAKSPVLRSYDVIEIAETSNGCEVTYDAILELNGPLKLADPLLGLVFARIGDKASAGLVKALSGTKVSS